MPVIDINEKRAARREAQKEPIEILIDEETFTLPVEMPFEIIEKLGPLRATREDADQAPEVATALLDIYRALLGPDQYSRFMLHRPSMQDLQDLLEGALAEYGVELGESSASTSS